MSQDIKKKFDDLQSRAQKVNESAIKLNTQIENAQENLQKVREAAQKKYGTSDLEKLKSMAEQWEKENEEKVFKFEEQVTSLEKEVLEKTNLIKQIQTN